MNCREGDPVQAQRRGLMLQYRHQGRVDLPPGEAFAQMARHVDLNAVIVIFLTAPW